MATGHSLNPALVASGEKLRRASEHLDAVASEIVAFRNRNPYRITVQFERDTGWWVATARISEEPGPRLSVLVGEVAYAHLSALNHLVWELAARKVGRRKVSTARSRTKSSSRSHYCDGCSTKAAYNRRWRAAITNPIEPRPYVRALPCEATCEACGDMYVKTWGPQLYCGKGSCGEFVTAACERCGREFEARTRDREHGWGRFYGKSCALRTRRAGGARARAV